MPDTVDTAGIPGFPSTEDLARNRRALLRRIEHRSRIHRRLAAAAVVAVVVLGGGAAGAPYLARWAHLGATTAEGSAIGGQVHASSLAVWYRTLGELKANSTIAVEGTVTRGSSPSSPRGVPGVDAELSIGRVLVDFGRVDEVDRGGVDTGRHAAPGQKIVVRQTGDTVANGAAVVEDPPFTVGETCIVFLREFEPGRYLLVGAQSGRFEVNDGLVAPAAPNGVPFSGTVDEFVAALNSSSPSPH